MSSEIAVRADGLSKSYRIAHKATRSTTLAEALVTKARAPFVKETIEEFWALRDVSFEIERGAVVGVIGRNGSGKSTLLKLLSRITEPTRGSAVLYGRVGSLLEVGSGFSGELTGRENIFLNGSILGMTRREIERQFDAIVDFAGVERFLDTPVKRYSSGMYVRLAFAVAAHLNPEILIADEVLAVGDADFQNKCIGKMRDVARDEGRTVLFVSHNMQSISVLCSQVVLMRGGQVAFNGDTQEGISQHLGSFAGQSGDEARDEHRPGSGEWRFVSLKPGQGIWDSADSKTFSFRVERRKPSDIRCWVQVRILNELGVAVAQCDSRFVEYWLPKGDVATGEFSFTTPWLKPGRYSVDAYVKTSGQNVDTMYDACSFEISPVLPYRTIASDGLVDCVVLSDFDWKGQSPADSAP